MPILECLSAPSVEISNILRSYTGYYDLFSELIQNALDAVEKRLAENGPGFDPSVWVNIDLGSGSVRVTDNGCGMDLQQLRQFLRPNFSFKTGPVSRGSKGVGATYLGYGFNSLTVSTKTSAGEFSGRIENGRQWVDDTSGTVPRPLINSIAPEDGKFTSLDRGTAISVKLSGENIRPRNLTWYQANNATQWLALLRIMTPAGGLYFNGRQPPKIAFHVHVTDQSGAVTEAGIDAPKYFYPHEVVQRSGSMVDFLKDQAKKIEAGLDASKVAPKFKGLSGLWGQWTNAQLLGEEPDAHCPIRLTSLDAAERELAKTSGVSIYVYLAFSTELWDVINDNQLKLRKGARVMHGGLQLATRHMPQGLPLTIPMTNNVGFQNLAHVIIHFENAEPDLGRKGFQPEYAQLAEKISVSAVTAFRRRYNLLRKPGVAKIFNDELKIDQWIKKQEEHEATNALTITGTGLFLPTEELPIRSEPLVEQDVVALFNQMLSSGLVRGIQLIASSQYNQYDGLYRVRMDPPFAKYIYGPDNPLGIEEDVFPGEDPLVTKTKVLEYKYKLNGLVEELQSGVKDVNDIGLAVAWEMGDKWREMFDVTSLLDEDTSHHRQVHGTTHSFTHSVSGAHAFEAVILHDLVRYLADPAAEQQRQRDKLDSDIL